MNPGDEITIGYLGRKIDARVLRVLRNGWVLVEQISDPGAGARYEAAVEYCAPRGETPPSPFGKLYG